MVEYMIIYALNTPECNYVTMLVYKFSLLKHFVILSLLRFSKISES